MNKIFKTSISSPNLKSQVHLSNQIMNQIKGNKY